MAKEIERKFLVKGEYKQYATGWDHIVQGFLSSVPERTVRVRKQENKAWITVKGITGRSGMTRYEWEKEISPEEAEELLKLCEPGTIDKTRYLVPFGAHTFEVDEFRGDNRGLVVAEIELGSEDEDFERPDWLGEEITGNERYYNASLAKNPYTSW